MLDALVAIARLLAPEHPDVVARVTFAHDDPPGFVAANADELNERDIQEPIPELAWIALVDGLMAHRLLAQIDWSEHPDEVVWQLRQLPSTPAGDAVWAWAEGIDMPTDEFIALCGDRLRPAGVTVASLDIDGDCYPLVTLPTDRVAELVRLVTEAGRRVDVMANTP